jgi:hypothetical protein
LNLIFFKITQIFLDYFQDLLHKMLTGHAFAAAADCSERKAWPNFAAGRPGWLGWLSVVYSVDPSSLAHA